MSTAIQTNFKRYEKKYLLTPEELEIFLNKIKPFIKPDEYPEYTICNIYYDTDNYSLIRTSLDKPEYKEKLRVRSYGVPENNGKVFVEIKKKFDSVVYKRRITTSASLAIPFLKGIAPADRVSQISKEISYFQSFYKTNPKVFIAYDRKAFQGIDNSELRITFDTNLRFRTDNLDLRKGDYGKPIIDTDKILMEVKIPGACPLWLSKALTELKLYPTSFSKYGTCYREHILKNNLNKFTKEALLSA